MTATNLSISMFPIATKIVLYYFLFLLLFFFIPLITLLIKFILFMFIYILLLIEFVIMEFYYKIKNRFKTHNLIGYKTIIKIFETLKPKMPDLKKQLIYKKVFVWYSILFFILMLFIMMYNPKPNNNHFVAIAKYIVEIDNSLNKFIKTREFNFPQYCKPTLKKDIQNKVTKESKVAIYYKLNKKTEYAHMRTSPTLAKDNITKIIDKEHILEYKNKKKKDNTGRVWLFVETDEKITGWVSSRVLVKCKD